MQPPEPYYLELHFDELPTLQGDVMQRWTRAKYRQGWYDKIAVAAHGHIPRTPLTTAAVFGCRYSSREPDRINLWYSFKPLLDGLIHAGIIFDDNPGILMDEDYSWQKAKPKSGSVSLRVQELDPLEYTALEHRLQSASQ